MIRSHSLKEMFIFWRCLLNSRRCWHSRKIIQIQIYIYNSLLRTIFHTNWYHFLFVHVEFSNVIMFLESSILHSNFWWWWRWWCEWQSGEVLWNSLTIQLLRLRQGWETMTSLLHIKFEVSQLQKLLSASVWVYQEVFEELQSTAECFERETTNSKL